MFFLSEWHTFPYFAFVQYSCVIFTICLQSFGPLSDLISVPMAPDSGKSWHFATAHSAPNPHVLPIKKPGKIFFLRTLQSFLNFRIISYRCLHTDTHRTRVQKSPRLIHSTCGWSQTCSHAVREYSMMCYKCRCCPAYPAYLFYFLRTQLISIATFNTL